MDILMPDVYFPWSRAEKALVLVASIVWQRTGQLAANHGTAVLM